MQILWGYAGTMKVIKVINNNVISSVDEKGSEIVVMGKGIGFQKKSGDQIDDTKVEKVFHLPSENMSQFGSLVADMPYEHVEVAREIIQYARKTLNRHLNKNIYISLTDHLNFAVERQKQNISFRNALLWEIKKFYHEEYEVGIKAIEMVKEKLGVELAEDEAGFMALHIVNAEMDGYLQNTLNATTMIKDILNIVQFSFGIALDESTLAYERFMTHLKFFVLRAVQGQCYEEDDAAFNKSIRESYPEAYKCAVKIKEYMEKKMKHEVTEEELTYLTVHIRRITK